MSDTSTVTFEQDCPLAILAMNNAPHNLIGPALMQDLLDALLAAEQAGSRAVLLKSGLRHFSAGAELSLFEAAMGGGQLTISPIEFLEKLESFPLPIVAAVHGVCVGGGFELALACDMVIASRTSKIGSVEATLGLNPLM